MNGRDHLEALACASSSARLKLVDSCWILGAVAGHVTHLAERIVEPGVLGELRELSIVLEAPVRPLFDLADDQTAADIGHPIGELTPSFTGIPLSLIIAPSCSLRSWSSSFAARFE